MILINVHGPNKKSGNFFNRLSELIGNEKVRNKALIIGDWNAQIGKEVVYEQEKKLVGEKLGFDTCNENGEEFLLFLQLNKLINLSSKIGVNTEVTWISEEKQSQIDHVIKPSEGALKVIFIKGYETGIRTDHKLLVTAVKSHKKINDKNHKSEIIQEAAALKDDKIRKKYHIELRKIDMHKITETSSIEEVYNMIANKMKTAATKSLKSTKIPLTPRRKKALNKVTSAVRMAKKHPDMQLYKWKLQNRKEEFEQAVREHREEEIKEFFRNMKDKNVGIRIQKSYKFLRHFVKRKNNGRINIPMKSWIQILKSSEGPSINLLKEQDTCPLTKPPTVEEMESILKYSCNGKSPGADGVKMEYLKYADEETKKQLTRLWQQIWTENIMPKEMIKSIQIPIPKKNKPKSAEDYRRISLCNVGYKPYAKWLKDRLRDFAGDPGLHQAAFTQGRSTEDHIYVTKRILEEFWNGGKKLYIAALDIRKAFDNINIEMLKSILSDKGVPTHIIDRVLLCVIEDRTRVKWIDQLSEEVVKRRGIKQGCPLSPYLFNLIMQSVLEKVYKDVPEVNKIEIGLLKPPLILAFADDLLVITKNKEILEKIVGAIEKYLLEVGLEINHDKTQIMIRDPIGPNNEEEIKLKDRWYKVCEWLKYLGISLTKTLDRPATVRTRCVNAVKTAKLVIEFCKKYKPPWDIGRLIYNTVIAPAILYGTKVATLTKRSRLQLDKYEKQIVREIWTNCRKEKRKSLNIRKELSGRTINRRIRVGRINYYGHIRRRVEGHPLYLAYKFKCKKRKEGRPSFTWKDSLNQDLNRYNNTSFEEWEELIRDKHKLKKTAEEIYIMEESEMSDGIEEEEEEI